MQMMSFTGTVELFDLEVAPWHYVRVPPDLMLPLTPHLDHGLVAVTAQVGETSWPTSLMPSGQGWHFVPLPAAVRKKEKVELDNEVTVTFQPRTRK